MSATAIKIRNLRKSFGGPIVLDGVDVDLAPGRINFIIGQSGGGKSVLLKHLVGLHRADAGEIWFDQKEMSKASERDWKELRRQMALLFQDGALFDSMNVWQNVAFPLFLHQQLEGFKARQKAMVYLKELDLEGAIDAPIATLSAGEKKRVALARALVLEPKILFFDEPTTGLDPILSAQVDELIVRVWQKYQATMVVISHDIPATLSIAHNIAMIHDGRIILTGSPDDFRQSSSLAVKQFLAGEAEGPMGFLD